MLSENRTCFPTPDSIRLIVSLSFSIMAIRASRWSIHTVTYGFMLSPPVVGLTRASCESDCGSSAAVDHVWRRRDGYHRQDGCPPTSSSWSGRTRRAGASGPGPPTPPAICCGREIVADRADRVHSEDALLGHGRATGSAGPPRFV